MKKKNITFYFVGKFKGCTYYRSQRKHPIKGNREKRQAPITKPEQTPSRTALATRFAKVLNPVVTTTYERISATSPYDQLITDLLADAIDVDDRPIFIHSS